MPITPLPGCQNCSPLTVADTATVHLAITNDVLTADALGGGGGSVGKVVWFENGISPVGSPGGDIPWEVITDGVAPFTDAALGGDPTQIVIVNGGAWHLNLFVQIDATSSADAGTVVFTIKRNDDSVGPLYDLTPNQTIPAGSRGSASLGIDLDFNDGDVLVFHVDALAADSRVQFAVLSGRRLGTPA